MICSKSTVAVLLFGVIAQPLLLSQGEPERAPIPETGYVSDSRYVNAFFGFSLPLPQDAEFRDLALPSRGDSHSIFGVQTQRNGLTALTVRASQSAGNQTEDARKAAGGPKGASVKEVE